MHYIKYWAVLFLIISFSATAQKKLSGITTSIPQNAVQTYEYWEAAFVLKQSIVANPFIEIAVIGEFIGEDGKTTTVAGFCDDQKGMVFKVRFMPVAAGKYRYTITIKTQNGVHNSKGEFIATLSTNQGVLRVDKENPWHFILDGTGKHFFWNATTTYWMLGWKDEKIIEQAIDRLARLKINRIRVAINGRAHGGSRWNENNVVESSNFTFKLNPWVAKKPDDLDDPQFDVSRFNVAHWQKLDRLVKRAKEKDIIVSLIFYVDGLDHGCDPFKKTKMGNVDEQRYYRYAVSRYSAFPNITWDITNEYHLFRNEEWVEKMGKLVKSEDPNRHLISVHGNADFPFRKSEWVDMVLYQSWDECGGYDFISNARKAQAATGRIIPQINEEYGYEDHYSVWGCGPTATKYPDGRSADNRRQLAWEMVMAGGHQTTGERANEGTGAGRDEGGGWINGRGNDSMVMLKGYAVMREIFEQTSFWKMQPANHLINNGNYCLATTGEEYLLYSRLPYCRLVLPKGAIYSVLMINPRTGETISLPDCDAANGAWQYPKTLKEDWAFIIKKIK